MKTAMRDQGSEFQRYCSMLSPVRGNKPSKYTCEQCFHELPELLDSMIQKHQAKRFSDCIRHLKRCSVCADIYDIAYSLVAAEHQQIIRVPTSPRW